MLTFFFNTIGITVHILFVVVIVGTVVVSFVYADRLRKRHSADFPWNKALAIIAIEVGLWIAFILFFNFFRDNWVWITIGTIIVLYIISKKKRRYS